ncbi:MAG: hypothetical protein GX053_08745 [Tissierella sp.]|nr:hypothetical protein [Tissierella sp.]
MKNKKIKIFICLILIFSIAVISACTDKNNTGNDTGQNGANNNTGNGTGQNDTNDNNNNNQNGLEDNENNQDGNDETVPPRNQDQDVDLTEKLLADEEVLDGQIYLREEWAIGAMTVKDEVSVERAQEIADEYAKQIKEKYPDKKVNVQVILNGENVANIEI